MAQLNFFRFPKLDNGAKVLLTSHLVSRAFTPPIPLHSQ